MMLQFSYSCDYYQHRMRLYCGENAAWNDDNNGRPTDALFIGRDERRRMMQYIVAYDFGTTGVKTCLFSIDGGIRMEASAYAPYGLYILPDGGAEQDTDEWWAAMCSTTRAAFEKTSVRPEQVTGISFCSQMQGMVLVDEHANALRRPMSYMDQRAGAEFRACQTHGLTSPA